MILKISRWIPAVYPLRRFVLIPVALSVLLTLGLCGCAQSPRMSEAEVVKVANRAAATAGYSLEKFSEPRPHFEFGKEKNAWTVFFEMKPPATPGGHFMVLVNDETQETQIMRGE